MKKKGAIEMETLVWIIVAVVILVVVLVSYVYLRKSGWGGIKFITDLFKFGNG